MALLEELNHIGASKGAAGLTLVFEDGEARDGEIDDRFEFVSLETSPEQSVEFLPHFRWLGNSERRGTDCTVESSRFETGTKR